MEMEFILKGIDLIDISNNKKNDLQKLAKYYKLKNYSRLNKSDLVEKIRKDCFNLSDIKDELEKIEPKVKLNPVEELELKISEVKDDPSGNKVENLKNCYAYRIWLWKNHGLTYEEEINRVFNLLN